MCPTFLDDTVHLGTRMIQYFRQFSIAFFNRGWTGPNFLNFSALGLKTKWRANVLLYPWYYSLHSLPKNALEQTNSVENTTPLEDSGLRGQNAELGRNFPISWSFSRCSRGLLGLSTAKDAGSSISNLSVLCSPSTANGARNLLLHNPLFGKTLKPVVSWWTSFIFF